MSIVRSYGLLVLWGMFAALIALSGFRPDGYFLRDSSAEEWRYPALGVSLVLVLSVAELALLWAILRPKTYCRSWRRSLCAAVVFLVLVLLFSMLLLHMPHYVTGHVLWLATLFLLCLVLFCLSVVATLRSRCRSTDFDRPLRSDSTM